MLIVISPAKTLDYDSPLPAVEASTPRLLDDAAKLVSGLRKLTADEVSGLMHISSKLGELNAERFKAWRKDVDPAQARPAVFAFKGDVYTGLEVERLSEEALHYAQDHLRILSGLYGVLRPLDAMQPYRLEMGTAYSNTRGKNLYEWWGTRITEVLNQDLSASGSQVLVNLASNEYFKAVKPALLDAEIITPVFQDEKNGRYKVISFYAKKARGKMAAWIVQNRIERADALQAFSEAGYRFDKDASTPDKPVFRRPEKAAS